MGAALTGAEGLPGEARLRIQLNPQNKERHVESGGPGELLCQDVYFVGHFKGVGKVYAHTCVDTYSSLGFAFLHTSKEPEAAAALLHNDVLPFYHQHQVPVQAILTDNGREFCGSENHLETHPFEVYLLLNDISHRRTRVRSPQTNGFVERFHRTLQEEFFAMQLRKTLYDSVEALQADLDAWPTSMPGWSSTTESDHTWATATTAGDPWTPS